MMLSIDCSSPFVRADSTATLMHGVQEAAKYTIGSIRSKYDSTPNCLSINHTSASTKALSAAYPACAALCPGIGSLFLSGYTENVIAHRGILREGIHFISRPFFGNALCAGELSCA